MSKKSAPKLWQTNLFSFYDTKKPANPAEPANKTENADTRQKMPTNPANNTSNAPMTTSAMSGMSTKPVKKKVPESLFPAY
jgi:hypothetical protein